ncbi:MAG: M28 family peptidase [Candidatus Thorarchaeota archaeon]|nr:MAG: M28 family peptidase [Candidatus Thorarchaeota archaeon]
MSGGNDLERPSIENIKEDLTVLCSIENKIAGTPNEKRAMEYVEGRLRGYGIENVESSTFEVQSWKPIKCILKVTKPVKRTLKSAMFPYYQSAEVKGDLVSVNNLSEGRASRETGMVGLAPWGDQLYHSLNMTYYRATEQNLKAILIASRDEGGLRKVVVVDSGRPLKVPVISISKEDGDYLFALLEKERVTVEIEAEAETTADAESMNLEVKIGGQGDVDHEIIVGTHVDSWFVGAAGNSASVAVLLELARLLNRHLRNGGVLKRRVKLLFFGAQNCGAERFYHWCIGSRVWVENHPVEVEKDAAVLSLESIGFPKPAQRCLVTTIDLSNFVRGLPVNEEAGQTVEYLDPPPAYGSDHWFFQISGVPTINGISYPSPLHHTQKDDLEHLDYDAVQYYAEFTLDAVLHLANRELLPIDLFGTLERFHTIVSKYNGIDNPFDIDSLLVKIEGIRAMRNEFQKALKGITGAGDIESLRKTNDFLVSATHFFNKTIGWLWRGTDDIEYYDVGYLSRLEMIEDYMSLSTSITSLRSTPLGMLGPERVERYESHPDNAYNWMYIHEPLYKLERERSRVFRLIDEEINNLSGILDRVAKGIGDIIGE